MGSLRDTGNAQEILLQLRTMPLFQGRAVLKAELHTQYGVLFARFADDVAAVEAAYKRESGRPPLLRDMPPVVSAICWARQLSRRIAEPLATFRDIASSGWFSMKDDVVVATVGGGEGGVRGSEGTSRRTLKRSRKLLRALAEFELRYTEEWVKYTSRAVGECFSKPILTIVSSSQGLTPHPSPLTPHPHPHSHPTMNAIPRPQR